VSSALLMAGSLSLSPSSKSPNGGRRRPRPTGGGARRVGEVRTRVRWMCAAAHAWWWWWGGWWGDALCRVVNERRETMFRLYVFGE
jgi:hypothetical protein